MRAARTELCVYHRSQLDPPAKLNLGSTCFGFNSESYDNDYFLITQNLEAAKDKQEIVIFFVCYKGMSQLWIQCLLRNINPDVTKLQKMHE